MNGSAVGHTKQLHINESCIIIVYIFKIRTLCTEPLENLQIIDFYSLSSSMQITIRNIPWLHIYRNLLLLLFFLMVKNLFIHFKFLLFFTQWETKTKEWVGDLALRKLMYSLGKKIGARGIPVNTAKQFPNRCQELGMINGLHNFQSSVVVPAHSLVKCVCKVAVCCE